MESQAADESKDYAIFVVSNEPWGKQWFSKHHYANELAEMGYEVFFITSVDQWKPGNLFKHGIKVEKIKPNLHVVSYDNFLPVRLLPKLMLRINDWVNSKKLDFLRKNKKLLIWQFDAFRFSFNFYRNSRKIYHVADHYRDLPFDRENIKNADLILCVSRTYMPYYSSFGKKIIYVPHAVSAAELETDETEVRDLKKKYGRYVLHAGTINDRLDLTIFLEVLEQFPDVNLLLLGPEQIRKPEQRKLFEKCLARENCIYPGTVEGAKIKNYVKASEACLVAYEFDVGHTLGSLTSSLKVLNYLAQKKPIVTSIPIEYGDLSGEAIFYAKDLNEYAGHLGRILDENTGGAAAAVNEKLVDEFLSRHNYADYIRKVFSNLE